MSPRPAAKRADAAPIEPRELPPAQLAEIGRALTQRDRAALRRLWIKFSAAVVPQHQAKWIYRLAFAAGEFEKANIGLQALLDAGRIEFADACLLLQVRDVLRIDLAPRTIFAKVAPDETVSLPPQQLAVLAKAAEVVFAAGAKAAAAPLFEYLDAQPGGQARFDRVHFGDALIASRRFERAFEVLRQADLDDPLPPGALCSLADAAMMAGDLASAEAAFDRIRASGHHSLYFIERYLEFLSKQTEFDQATAFLHGVADQIPAESSARLALVLAIAQRDLDQVLAAASGLSSEAMGSLAGRLAEFGYILLNSGRDDGIDRIEALAGELAGDHPQLLQLTIDLAFRRQDFEAAARMIDRGRRSADEAHAPLFQLKRAELLAFMGQLDEAVQTIAALGPPDAIRPNYLSPIATIYSEAKAWPQILHLAATRLEEWFVFESHGAAVLAAAEAEAGWDDLMAAIERAMLREPNTELAKLKLATLERLADATSLHDYLGQSGGGDLEGYANRLRARALAIAPEAPAAADGGIAADERACSIFYCADSNFLSPAFNSINSLLLANAPFVDDIAIELFVDEGDVALAEEVAAALRDRYNCALTVRSAARLLDRFDGTLKTSYGLFTGGKNLAQSAYYRIFALQGMLAAGTRRRALYVDADTLVTGEISRIFATLDGTAPMAARPEVDKFEVRRVERLHELPRGSYFNSGVLVFDMDHPDLAAALERTIAEIRESPDNLIYHDQCALNRGFRGAVTALPEQYNSFCTSRDTLTSLGAAGIILHFLDRPKPWQAGYGGPFAVFWYRYWRELAKVAGPALMERLLAASPV